MALSKEEIRADLRDILEYVIFMESKEGPGSQITVTAQAQLTTESSEKLVDYIYRISK